MMNFFFFQAEDGIRDYKVTGVQTCALPDLLSHATNTGEPPVVRCGGTGSSSSAVTNGCRRISIRPSSRRSPQNGRGAGRGKGENSGGGGLFKKKKKKKY